MTQKKRYLPPNVYSLRDVIRGLKIGNSYNWLRFFNDLELTGIVQQYCGYEYGTHPKNNKPCHLLTGTFEQIDTAYRKAYIRYVERKIYKR